MPATPSVASSRTRLTVVAVGLVVAALLLVLGRAGGAYVPAFAARVHALGAWGPAAYVAGYVVATVAGIPGSLLTLAAGAIFGLAAGTLWALTGATLGASSAFLVARHLARDRVERRAAGDARFHAIDRAVAADGRRIVFLLRLSPAIPFVLLNYLLGLTRVRFRDYVVASVGMLPGTLLYVYTGKVAGDVAAATAGRAPARGTAYYVVLALGLAATAVVTVLVTRTARRALRSATGAPADGAPAAIGGAA
jgi:uncharacterized membrane protein YdjX (TVP38/TMEM64 family)